MELPPACVDLALIRELSALEPCGTGNSRPLFAVRNILLRKTAVFGRNRNVIRLEGSDDTGAHYDFVWFTTEDRLPEALADGPAKCHVAYEPKINVWKGRESLQFVIKDVKCLS